MMSAEVMGSCARKGQLPHMLIEYSCPNGDGRCVLPGSRTLCFDLMHWLWMLSCAPRELDA